MSPVRCNVWLSTRLTLDSLGFLFQPAKRVARRYDALIQVLFKKRLKTTESLILSGVRQFVDNQSALAPRLRPNENPIPESQPRGAW